MKIVNRKIAELKPTEYNPRTITDKQFKDLQKSIKKFEVVEPAIVNMNAARENIIISGHQRIKAAAAIGLKEYPCIETDLAIDNERELNIRMNKAGGDWDMNALEANFELDDLVYFGFEPKELNFDDGEPPKEKRKKELTMICPECGHKWTK